MRKLIRPGQLVYAIATIGLGVLCFLSSDFIVGRPPASSWAGTIPGITFLAYCSGALLLLTGIAIIIRVKAALATTITAIVILLFSFVLRHMYEMSDWINAFKALALGGSALIVAASFLRKMPGKESLTTDFIFAGRIFFSLFLIVAGLSHLKFYGFVVDFIPGYIPGHPFWTYLTATALLAGGTGLLFNPTKKAAALWSGIMIGGWFLLLHIPRFLKNPRDASDRLGVFESLAFAGVLFVLAGLLEKRRPQKTQGI